MKIAVLCYAFPMGDNAVLKFQVPGLKVFLEKHSGMRGYWSMK